MHPLTIRLCAALSAFALSVSLALAQEAAPPALSVLMRALSKTEDAGAQLNLLRGINAAMKGRRNVTAPPEWAALAETLGKSASAEVREQAQTLGGVFGSSGAFDAMRATLADASAERAAREKALESLVAAKDQAAAPILQQLAKEPGSLRRGAIRGLAAFDDDATAGLLLSAYASLDSEEKRDALGTLLARPAWALGLVAALESGKVPVADLAAPQVRQLKGFKNPQIDAWLAAHPELSVSSADKQAEIARYKTFLTAESLKDGDVNRGRAFFAQTCAACHVLFGTGGTVGPELTGANRADIDYLLQNILDPNALIGSDYQSTTIETKDGRILAGMIRGEDANAVTLKTLADAVIVPRSDIQSLAISEVSMMPEGLLAAMKPEETRDLFAYLASPRQAPLLATPMNAADFFNGSDLSRWRSAGEAWRVEEGEIVGRGPTAGPLISDMVAEEFTFTAQIRISGEKAAAEIAFRGQPGVGAFRGASLSFGGPSRVNVWKYAGEQPESIAGPVALTPGKWHACEIAVAGGRARVSLDGKMVLEVADLPGGPRTAIAFYLSGEGAELRVKDARLEIPAK